MTTQSPQERLAVMTAEELAASWLEAKETEDSYKEWRGLVEERMAALLPHKPEGSKTTKQGDYNVTLTGRLYRKLDRDKWEAIKDRVPEDLRPIKVVEELDEAGVKWLAEHRPDVYAVLAEAVTTTPGKLGVKVTRKEAT